MLRHNLAEEPGSGLWVCVHVVVCRDLGDGRLVPGLIFPSSWDRMIHFVAGLFKVGLAEKIVELRSIVAVAV